MGLRRLRRIFITVSYDFAPCFLAVHGALVRQAAYTMNLWYTMKLCIVWNYEYYENYETTERHVKYETVNTVKTMKYRELESG